jgi:hypothetical protein
LETPADYPDENRNTKEEQKQAEHGSFGESLLRLRSWSRGHAIAIVEVERERGRLLPPDDDSARKTRSGNRLLVWRDRTLARI